MARVFPIAASILLATGIAGQEFFLASGSNGLAFEISYAKDLGTSVTGRVRLTITPGDGSHAWSLLFGKDVEQLKPGQMVSFSEGDSEVFGYPARDLSALHEKGVRNFQVEAELVAYDLYERKDMPPTWLPTSCVNKAGTMKSKKVNVTSTAAPVRLLLDHALPDRASPGCAGLGDGVDSKWIKTVRLNSSRLEVFWGRPVELEACVLLPWGYDEHEDAHYPLVVAHNHYNPQWTAGGGFRETAPDCDERSGHDCFYQWDNYRLYRNWTDPKGVFHGSRFLVMTVNHAVPFFDDSYAVNSANMGPYGDAINYELLPEVEKRFRGIGQGWARGLMGGSTGGWEAFGVQVLYPDEYNYAHAACPDPLTFTSYVSADIYKTKNYFYYDDPWLRRDRPSQRDHYSGTSYTPGVGPAYVDAYGEITQTIQEANHQEYAKGTHSRSCEQYDIWEAVFSPACPDGFPCRLYDKLTGEINQTVAKYWRDNYDFAHIIERDWETLGPKLQGKIHVAVGGSDTFYLTNSVLDLRKTFEKVGLDAEVTIGAHEGLGFQHCFNGYLYDDQGVALPNTVTRDRYVQTFIPKMAARFAATAPSGADVTSWRY